MRDSRRFGAKTPRTRCVVSLDAEGQRISHHTTPLGAWDRFLPPWNTGKRFAFGAIHECTRIFHGRVHSDCSHHQEDGTRSKGELVVALCMFAVALSLIAVMYLINK
jgi:hypothetical protein